MPISPFTRLTTKLRGFREIMKFDNWLSLAIERTFFHSRFSNYKFRNHSYLVDTDAGDVNSVRYCLTTTDYDAAYSLVKERKNDSISLLDIGANAGGFALRCFHEGLPLKKVVSIEFHPETCHRLAINLHQAYGRKASAVNVAIAAKDGTIDVDVSEGSTGESIYQGNGADNAISIPTQTFDTIANTHFPNQRIELCKIDIEGAEYEAILEGDCNRLADVDILAIEIHPHAKYSRESLLMRLASFGLQPVASLTDQVVLLARPA